MEQFEAKFKKDFGEHISRLYIPEISQKKMFRLIFFHLLNTSAEVDLAIHKVHLMEVADKEYIIKVNHNIEINYLIDQRKEAESEK